MKKPNEREVRECPYCGVINAWTYQVDESMPNTYKVAPHNPQFCLSNPFYKTSSYFNRY